MIKFALPGLYEHFDLNMNFIDYMLEYPERFYDDMSIAAIYGNFQFCIFDGGRIFDNYNQASKEQVESITQAINNRNIPVRLIYTNNQLEEKHYSDRFGNLVLEIANEQKINEVVIANEKFGEYIKNKYPNLKLISSTTKCLSNSLDAKKEINKDYFLTCLDYNLNHDFEFLKSLTQKEKDKTEFLINAICPAKCPNRKKHYELNSIYHLNFAKPYIISDCGIVNTTVHPETRCSANNISLKEILEIYKPMGFTNFKIEGRSLHNVELILNYVNYMVKPEWRDETITNILYMIS